MEDEEEYINKGYERYKNTFHKFKEHTDKGTKLKGKKTERSNYKGLHKSRFMKCRAERNAPISAMGKQQLSKNFSKN